MAANRSSTAGPEFRSDHSCETMAKYTTKLNERRDVAEGTMAFFLEKPAGLQFKAGQYMNFTLIDPPETDAEGNTRSFSIASAPFEADLAVATRMRDTAFKRVLRTLSLKSESGSLDHLARLRSTPTPLDPPYS